MEIFFSIVLIVSCVFCILVVMDRAIFAQRTKTVEIGMTGKEVQQNTGLKLKIINVEGNNYTAILFSTSTFFKLRLVFTNGRLISKQRFQ